MPEGAAQTALTYYLSTVLDDLSRYIVAWKLCATMQVGDVTATLDLALAAAGLDHVQVAHRPRLLSDNGPSYGLAPQKWRALFLKEEGSDGRPEADLYPRVSC